MSGQYAIEVQDLRKLYGQVEAVRGIDLRVRSGEVFALLGPNGAGKTTAVEILEGHRKRSAGQVDVLGFDPGLGQRSFRQRIGIVLQETGVDPYLTVEETIDLYRGYYPKPRQLGYVLNLVDLEEHRATRVVRLSGGQKRRLDVAIGLSGDPDLLFLDEPTTGFDPAARHGAWQMIEGLKSLGKTVFLTTHYMDEAEYLADRVAIIRRGEIIAEGPPHQLMDANPVSTIRFRSSPQDAELLSGIGEVSRAEDDMVSIETSSPTAVLYELTQRAKKRDHELDGLTVSRASLEDAYLKLVEDSIDNRH